VIEYSEMRLHDDVTVVKGDVGREEAEARPSV
jgi:hypothetical protein